MAQIFSPSATEAVWGNDITWSPITASVSVMTTAQDLIGWLGTDLRVVRMAEYYYLVSNNHIVRSPPGP